MFWDASAAKVCGSAHAANQREGRVLALLDYSIDTHALSADDVPAANCLTFGQLAGLMIEDWIEGS